MSEDWDVAVAIVAHPDDLEYGPASAVARWTSQGKSVVYVVASHGEAGLDAMPPDKAAALREREQRDSAAVVGVNEVVFLDHADGCIEYGLALRRDMASALRRYRPDIVVITNFDLTWGDGEVNHADHRAVGLAALDACRDAANRWMFPELGAPWHGVEAVYVAGSPTPSHFVDVAEHLEIGIASLREHKVYIEGLGRHFDPEEFLRDLTGFGGAVAGCESAVLFQRYTLG